MYRVGQYVFIVNLRGYGKTLAKGMIGKITRLSGSSLSPSYGLTVDGYRNNSSQYGVFWFKEEDLRSLDDCKEETMEDNNMSKQLKGFKKVAGIEIGGNIYYYALYDDNISEGDHVIVSGAAYGKIYLVHSTIDVTEDTKFEFPICSEIICKVDTSAYEKRVDDRKRSEELMAMMDKKIKEMDEINKYAIYAQQNPELAEMLAEFKQLNGLK